MRKCLLHFERHISKNCESVINFFALRVIYCDLVSVRFSFFSECAFVVLLNDKYLRSAPSVCDLFTEAAALVACSIASLAMRTLSAISRRALFIKANCEAGRGALRFTLERSLQVFAQFQRVTLLEGEQVFLIWCAVLRSLEALKLRSEQSF